MGLNTSEIKSNGLKVQLD